MTLTSMFALPDRLEAKATAARIGADERRLREIAVARDRQIAALEERLRVALETRAADAQGRIERDATVAHCRDRLRLLHRFGPDAILGRMTPVDGADPVYVGRIGIDGDRERPLLLDWRSPAARPFFAATRAEPHGVASRRRYRWSGGTVRDYWDEALIPDAVRAAELSLDDESALLAALDRARGDRMQDVLTTLAADQDAIIRADARGPLLVDGGPGTGKTVVALHRAAYLLGADPRLQRRRDGILVVGPHRPYLHYVADVLPSLGEEDVATCTLVDLVPEGATALPEPDPEVARLKGGRALVDAIGPAVALYEEPPAAAIDVETTLGTVRIGPDDWADAFAAPGEGTAHNLARPLIWDELAEIARGQLAGAGADEEQLDDADLLSDLEGDTELRAALHRAWPLLEPADLVGDLWEVPAYLRRCAPTLTPEQVRTLHRSDPQDWTDADLPLLDAARHRLGDPGTEAAHRRRAAARAERAREMDSLVDYLVATDSSEMRELSMLRGADLRDALGNAAAVDVPAPDRLAGPFAHIVVDEAQELTDAQWAMILRRCPSRSLTLVGDRAQAAAGFTESWAQRLDRVGLDRVEQRTLTINYRTPAEIMAVAEPVIREAIDDANVPTSIREAGMPVRRGAVRELEEILAAWLADHDEGTACVIGGAPRSSHPRVTGLSPRLAKGLEFDLVVLVEPESFGGGVAGAAARYVAMTRSTRELVILGQDREH